MAQLDIESWRQEIRLAGVIFAVLAAPLPAYAQTEMTTGDESIEEIIVTGSRLIRRDFVAPSPILTIEREALEFSGQGTLETVLNQMPQVTPSLDRTTNNGSDGTAQINLRGLGSGRTLVMLNGRRVAPSGIGTAVDINNLPQVLIERVEVITGGATIVYGSDAVAGVVNFITRDDFDGFALDVSGYVTEKGDSNIHDLNATYGHNFADGRGNVTFFAGYYDREETYADSRKLTSVPWSDTWEGELVRAGSARVPQGAVLYPEVDFGNGPAWVIFDADGNPREFVEPDDLYNWAPYNYLQTPLTRYSGGLFFNYDLSSRAEAYAEAAFTRNEHRAVLAPVPAGEFFLFNTDNPVMTPATRQLFADNFIPEGPNLVSAVIVRRFEEFGPRIIENNHDYLRILAGVRGDIWTDWEFDAWVTYTDAEELTLQLNDGSQSRFQQGLLVDPVTGECFDASNGCVPINWFGRGNLSPDAVDFIRLPPLEDVTSRTQLLASAFVRGKLFDTWAGSVQSAFGIEWRSDDGSYRADDYLFTGDTLGYNPSSPVTGKESVYEIYAEMLIPLAEDVAFADYLGLEIGGRYSEYDHAGDVNTWKVGLEWQPLASLRFRSMFQRSVRAPNLYEAFEEQSMNDGVFAEEPMDDPCSAESDPVAAGNVEKCIATGLPADQIGIFNAGPSTTIFISGGNPDLEPEVADTLTAGFIFSPAGLPNVQLAIDYFDIEVDGEIADLAVAEACFDPANVNNLYCDSIKRNPITYDVSEVRAYKINRGLLKTTGIDTQLNYSTDLPQWLALGDGAADLTINLVWTHVNENSYQATPFSSIWDCAGRFGWPCLQVDVAGATFPRNRVTTSLSYASGDLTTYLSWRWIAPTDNAAPLNSAAWGYPDPDLAIPSVADRTYMDLGIGYRFSDNIAARLTIANLTGTAAPNMADAVIDKNTDTSMYDIYGRSYTLSFSLNY